MIHFVFPFTFKLKEYNAGCHVIPDLKKQYHITPYDDTLKENIGFPIIFMQHEPGQFNYGATPKNHPDADILVASLATGLFKFLKENPKFQ